MRSAANLSRTTKKGTESRLVIELLMFDLSLKSKSVLNHALTPDKTDHKHDFWVASHVLISNCMFDHNLTPRGFSYLKHVQSECVRFISCRPKDCSK